MTELETRLHAQLIRANQLLAMQSELVARLTSELPDDLETVSPGLGAMNDSVFVQVARDLVQIQVAIELGNIEAAVKSVEEAEPVRDLPFWSLDVVDPAMMDRVRNG